jgi:preprotein translocase subunit YajC
MAQEPSGTQGGGFLAFLPFILIILIIYLFMMRPQMKRQKETQRMLASLRKGDKVVTVGGIYGTIEGFKEKDSVIILKISKDTKVEVKKSAISGIVSIQN